MSEDGATYLPPGWTLGTLILLTVAVTAMGSWLFFQRPVAVATFLGILIVPYLVVRLLVWAVE